MTAVKYAYAFIALGICAASLGATTAQAAEAAASSPAQTETTAPIALAPVTISDHGETLTMLLPQLPAFQKEEQSFPAIGFSISKYTARAEAAGLDVLVQHSVFADDGTAPPTLDEAVAGARDAIAFIYGERRVLYRRQHRRCDWFQSVEYHPCAPRGQYRGCAADRRIADVDSGAGGQSGIVCGRNFHEGRRNCSTAYFRRRIDCTAMIWIFWISRRKLSVGSD